MAADRRKNSESNKRSKLLNKSEADGSAKLQGISDINYFTNFSERIFNLRSVLKRES